MRLICGDFSSEEMHNGEMHSPPHLELIIHHYHPNDDDDPHAENWLDDGHDDGNGSHM